MSTTVILLKGEKIITDAGRCYYAGVTYETLGGGFGSHLTGGVAGGVFSSKQIKREGSFWDAKSTHIYLTNKRIIFCNAKFNLIGTIEKDIGSPFSEIPLKSIRGINKSLKLSSPAIDISMVNPTGNIDNVKFWFLPLAKNTREKERDMFLEKIKKHI